MWNGDSSCYLDIIIDPNLTVHCLSETNSIYIFIFCNAGDQISHL